MHGVATRRPNARRPAIRDTAHIFTDIDLADAEMNTAFNIITYVPFPTPRTNMAYIITSSSQLQDFVAQSRSDVFWVPTPLDGCVRIIFFSHRR